MSLQDIIAEDMDLSRLLREHPQDRSTVLANLSEVYAQMTPSYVHVMKALMGGILERLYEGFHIQCDYGMDLEKLVQTNNVVFVANHQSHADYVVFNYLLYEHYGITAFTAGGINLNIFLLGRIFKNLGCIFIRRTFHHDMVYKLSLKAYIRFLLDRNRHPLEFYYEGGRSRNGMLMTPRFGMFNMILESHRELQAKADARPLLFIPVSLVHEQLPEQKSLAREVFGGEKKPESFIGLFKSLKVLTRKWGNVHIKIGEPIPYRQTADHRKDTQAIGFQCFRQVAAGIPVSSIALCSSILLDAPFGGISWDKIQKRALMLLKYCETFHIGLAKNLQDGHWQQALLATLDKLVAEKIIKKVYISSLNQTQYVVKYHRRIELCYFKNTILHHFIVPFIILLSWLQSKRGRINSVSDLEAFILDRRKELKYDLYLPTIPSLWETGLKTLSYYLNQTIDNLDDYLALPDGLKDGMGTQLGVFGNFFRYKYEAYYLSGITLLTFGVNPFSADTFFKSSRELFDLERSSGQIIKHPESYSQPVMKNTLSYALNRGLIKEKSNGFVVSDIGKIKDLILQYATDLSDLQQINLKNTLDLIV